MREIERRAAGHSAAARSGPPLLPPARLSGRRWPARRSFGPAPGRSAKVGAIAVGLLSMVTMAWAYFTSQTGNASSFATGDVEALIPSSVVAAWASPTTCDVSWTPAAGTPAGVGYDVLDGAGSTLATGVTGTSVTLTVGSTDFTPTVRARVGQWVSTAQTAAAAPGCRGVPGVPTAVGAIAGDTTSTVSWTAPAWSGSGAITSYSATAVPSDGALPTRTCSAAASPCTITALTNGATYTVSVTATNAAGTGNPSTTTTVVPYPTALFAASDLRVWLDAQHAPSLSAAADCSGSGATTGTGIGCWKDRSGNGWHAGRARLTAAVLTDAAINGHPALRLVPSNPDMYAVTAAGIRSVGSADRSVLAVAQARTTPDSGLFGQAGALALWPTEEFGDYLSLGLEAGAAAGPTADRLRATLWSADFAGDQAWSPSTGAAVMSGIWSSTAGPTVGVGVAVNGAGTLQRTELAGVWPPVGDLQIGARSAAGGGPTSIPLDGDLGEIMVFDRALSASERRVAEEYLARRWGLPIAPAAPTGVTGTRGNAQVAVTWAAPAWNGGSAVTGYTVTASPGGATCTTASTGCMVTGLVNGTPYTFTVTATNAAGTGPASAASAAVTPATTPGAPSGVAATIGDTTSSVSWSAPASNGGSAITGYTVTAVPSDGSLPTRTCTSGTSPCTLTTLTNGARYSITVAATNDVGTGPASSSVTVIPYPSGVMTGAAVKLWLDGADSSTLYADDTCAAVPATSTVGCWRDKSASANHATQPTVGNQPVLGAIGSHPAPTFDGTDDGATFDPALLPTGTSTGTEIVVAAMTDAAPTSHGWRTLLNYGTASTGQKRFLGKEAAADRVWFDTHGGGSTTPGSWVTGQPAVVLAEAASANTRSTMNGMAWTPQTPVAFNTGTTLGQLGFGAVPWQGPIAEVIVLNTTLSDVNRRQIEEYLARKWGVVLTPAAPTAVIADDGDGEALVTWTAPSWNGGSAITGYTVTSSPGGHTCVVGDDDGTSCTVTGLTNGTAYTFTVTATNDVGVGPASAASNSVTPVGPPGAPTGVTASAADTASSVSWSAPASNGGSAITSYTATAVPSTGGLPTRTCSNAVSPCTITGLTNGVTYTVTVDATNALGTSAASTATTVIPYPAGVMTGAATKLWLDGADPTTLFTASNCTGAVGAAGQPIACWRDRSGTGNHVTQTAVAEVPVSTTVGSRLIPGFDGTNDELLRATPTLPSGASASTTLVVATTTDADPAGAGERVIYWAGGNVAGAARSLHKPAGSAAVATDANLTAPDATDSAFVTNTPQLAVSTFSTGTYSLRAAGRPPVSQSYAYNTATSWLQISSDVSSWKGTVSEVITLDTALSATDTRTLEEYLARKWGTTLTPSAPGTPTAVAGTAAAGVTWAAPFWNGGAAVSGYTVTASPGGATCTTASTGCTVTGLTSGTAYTFTVTATNSAGTGPASAASNSVTPLGPPGAPTGVAASAADTTSSVSWSAPAWNGGSAITAYTASAVPSDGSLPTRTCTGAASPCTVTGLTNGVTYTVSVTATNANGTSAASTAATVIPYPASVMTGAATKLWLDGADSSTLYAANTCTGAAAATTIGCWKDKSASLNHAKRAAGSAQPTLTTVAGRSVPGFDGTDDQLDLTPGLLPNGSNPSTGFVVAGLTDPSPGLSGWRGALAWGTAADGQRRGFTKRYASATAVVDNYMSGQVEAGTWTSSPGILVGEMASAKTTGWFNGRPAVGPVTYAFTTGTTAAHVGREVSDLEFWQGPVPEVIVLNTSLTAGERRQVEEYLARKWGTTLTPSAPTAPSVVVGANQATVSWTAPAWNGGSAVTSYTVTASPGGGSCTVAPPATSCTVTGLTSELYSFTVAATNSAGTGPSSSAVTGRPTLASGLLIHAWGSQIGTSPVAQSYGLYRDIAGTESLPGSSGPSGCGVRTDGTLWCAGVNSHYQLGDGTNTTRAEPVQIGSETTWAKVSMGRYHTCAVRTDGTLWCWGSNTSGALGVGDTTTRTAPTQLSGTTWASVSAGWDHTCATRTDGTLWCWGKNGTNAVGDGSTTDRWSPVQVGTATTWASVSTGWEYACATRTDQSLWCWGENADRQLGDGTVVNKSTPTQIGVGASWAWVDTGRWHTCATRTDGTLWCWGANADGELGLGNNTNKATPTQVGALTTWVRPGLGQTHTCATRTNGTMWCWGSNSDGEVGDGSTTERTLPVQVGSATTWSAPSAGGRVTYAGQPPVGP